MTGEGLKYDGTGVKPANVKERRNLEKGDIYPEIPEPGGTVLVLQVNARDDRSDPRSADFGKLTPEAEVQTVTQATSFFSEIFTGLEERDRENVAIAVFASDATLIMPHGITSPHQRACETAQKVIEGINTSMTEYRINPSQLLNNTLGEGGKPIPVPGLVDLKMWEKPDEVEKLHGVWGEGQDFWSKYESDWRDLWRDWFLKNQISPEVELPEDIAVRVRAALTDLTVNFARQYHEEHPNARLIIWVDGMYDALSPWLKGYVYNTDPAHVFAPIEKGGGLTIKISPNSPDGQTATCKIGSQEYSIPSLLNKPTKASERRMRDEETK